VRRNGRRIVTLSAIALLPASLTAQPAESTPEQAIRAVVRAIYAADGAAFTRLSLPHPRLHVLTTGGSPNDTGMRALTEDPKGLQIRASRPLQFKGTDVTADSLGRFPEGTTGVYVVAHQSGPMVMVLERRPDGWKVDPRWWIAAVEMTSADYAELGTPAESARSLLWALLSGDRERAAALATPRASIELLFAGAPSQREPSGHLEALVGEMPIVEMRPGEFRRLATGEVVEGSDSDESRLLVGLMGQVEIPFVVERAGGEWRVRPQPYFAYLNR
jgi:hypothetical protein